jgi:two-component system cell cycle response regulator
MGVNILFIENNKTQAEQGMERIRKLGHEANWAKEIKAVKEAMAQGETDLLILDLELPDGQSEEIYEWLKVDPLTRAIPVIMLARMDNLDELVSGFDIGADDYLNKPYSGLELKARINAALRTKALMDELSIKSALLRQSQDDNWDSEELDSLTGLYNRKYFESILKREYKRMLRYGFPLACFILEVDNLKNIVDEYGRKVRELVLKTIAGILIKEVRDVDLVARWDGEKFIVLLPQTGKDDALMVAHRLLISVAANGFEEYAGLNVTVSIGMAATKGKETDSAESVLAITDKALYEAEASGGNTVICV